MFLAGHETTAMALDLDLVAARAASGGRGAAARRTRRGAGRANAHARRRAGAALHARRDRRVDAALPAGLGRRAARVARRATLGGWTVPKGSIVLMSQWITHRDPRFWREPDAFRPERWSNGETDGLPKFAYFPFGGGDARVHRRGVRVDRTRARPGDDRALPALRGGTRTHVAHRAAVGHAAAGNRRADDRTLVSLLGHHSLRAAASSGVSLTVFHT